MKELASMIGQKIRINNGINKVWKDKKFDGLYKEGDILTVKTFSNIMYEYGTDYHIYEVEEFPTPIGAKVVILPIEYDIFEEITN